jgi:hypothetical protein
VGSWAAWVCSQASSPDYRFRQWLHDYKAEISIPELVERIDAQQAVVELSSVDVEFEEVKTRALPGVVDKTPDVVCREIFQEISIDIPSFDDDGSCADFLEIPVQVRGVQTVAHALILAVASLNERVPKCIMRVGDNGKRVHSIPADACQTVIGFPSSSGSHFAAF